MPTPIACSAEGQSLDTLCMLTKLPTIDQGTEYTLGDFAVRICRTILKPGEEVRGAVMDVEYMPADNAIAAHPALLVRSIGHFGLPLHAHATSHHLRQLT